MKNIRIVIPDLFLPGQLAAYASGDMALPALEKLLARSQLTTLASRPLEQWLCDSFGIENGAIAPFTLVADGVPPLEYYWLRADPVHIVIQRDQLVLQESDALSVEDAAQLCASLNAHFAVDGLHFVAPHPQRWYLRLTHTPELETDALPQVIGENIQGHLPRGKDSLRWHSVFNEIQMLFYEHSVNQARERCGKQPVSALWLWGGGKLAQGLLQPFSALAGDSVLAGAIARAAGVPIVEQASILSGDAGTGGELLLVCEGMRGALQRADIAQWRSTLAQFEKDTAAPLLAALVSGRVERITIDILSDDVTHQFVLTRTALLKFWRLSKPLLHYARLNRQD
jgi:hypothetical protein